MTDVNVKGVTTLEMITKLWDNIPDATKNELIENEDDIIKGITVLEQALDVEETIIKPVTIDEPETDESEPETEGETE